MAQFLGPEIVKMVQQLFWVQKLKNGAIFWSRNSLKISISGPRNGENGATNIPGPETDIMGNRNIGFFFTVHTLNE